MKVERLLAIVIMLLNKRRVSARELSDHFEVSLRTVYRDLETINAAGIPIVAYPGASGGYEIMENFTIDRQYLSLDELVAVIAALKGVHSSTDDKQIGQLLEKIKALLITAPSSLQGSAHPVVYDFNPWGSTPAIAEKVNRLREAIEKRLRVRITYTKMQGDATERTIEPVKLIIKGYVWYVYGYCLQRQEDRLFRLSRIADMSVLTEEFSPRPYQQADKLEWLEEWDTSERISLVLQFSSRVHVRVRDMFEPKAIETMPDGSLLVRTMMTDDEWLNGMLLSFGDALFVHEPVHVRERMRDIVKRMTKLYE
ncbi:YafY family transcriptional regulator [Brevibacillus sp. HB1.4B]|uniref:helix-turn-helix transcriptional regulator n=1 Tax=Brevibacillus sp. HB1.4B TaxID=2738845 RepID=UPI00156BAC26|nr:YafY family protein [Brevibacillus sp. HB1.4B]NRS15214.1 YafY family transcriptional regulator [Brevibacillus sp. HB1.4B]